MNLFNVQKKSAAEEEEEDKPVSEPGTSGQTCLGEYKATQAKLAAIKRARSGRKSGEYVKKYRPSKFVPAERLSKNGKEIMYKS